MLQNPDDKRGFAYEIFNIDADMEILRYSERDHFGTLYC